MQGNVSELTAQERGSDTGVKFIIQKLDKLFLLKKNTDAYLAFKAIYNFHQALATIITEFVAEFEHLHHRLIQHDIKLREGAKSIPKKELLHISKTRLDMECITPAFNRQAPCKNSRQ